MVTPRHIGFLLALVAALAAGAAPAQTQLPTGAHDFRAKLPDGCVPGDINTGASPADVIQRFAAELNITGQQQQDIQILTADYGQRLRDLAQLGVDDLEQVVLGLLVALAGGAEKGRQVGAQS